MAPATPYPTASPTSGPVVYLAVGIIGVCLGAVTLIITVLFALTKKRRSFAWAFSLAILSAGAASLVASLVGSSPSGVGVQWTLGPASDMAIASLVLVLSSWCVWGVMMMRAELC